jgi:alpha-beta hydrolase superfamily lysophospholipase
MEKVACDLGEAIHDAKSRLGYSRIILAGWSGGGSLSMWYQALAEAGHGISDTAGGDSYIVGAARLPAVDGIMMLAAHVSRHQIFTEWIDPSILDEAAPHIRTRELNLYDSKNPNQPAYSADFLATFAQKQIDRNRRITAWVKDKLLDIRASNEPNREFAFTVHGTMADPRWLDPTIERSDRAPGHCYLGDPKVVNDGPVGLARFCSLRSWLSQWSFDDARCDAVSSGAKISVPVLVVGNTADDACTPSHTQRLFECIGHDNKQLHMVKGATHYYTGPDGSAHQKEAVAKIGEFISTV